MYVVWYKALSIAFIYPIYYKNTTMVELYDSKG